MSHAMPNSFLIFRLVSFGLLCNLALLQLIFASWNIGASLSIGLSAPSTSIFIILETCVLFLCVAFALVDFIWFKGRNSRILLECSWVGIMGLFQIGIAINNSVTGPGMVCQASLEWTVCASSLLLVPSTWLSSMIFFAYFLTLFITTMAHKCLCPDIWRRSMYGVVWFGQSQETVSNTSRHDVAPYIDYYEDIKKSSARKRLYPISDPIGNTAPWAANRVRRGIDPPFSRQPKSTGSNRSSPTVSGSNLSFPSYPNKSAKSDTGSRFIEKFRESTLLTRSNESLEHFVVNHQVRQDYFPLDIDAPIPLPRLSEWVRADALNPHTSVQLV